MCASKVGQGRRLDTLLKAATDLHGHFGPFLVLGVRIGLIGLKEIKAKAGETHLHVTAKLEYSLPFSCMLDGIQTATKCTIGNKRLSFKDSKELGATFLIEKGGHQVDVIVNSNVVQELRQKLQRKKPLSEETRQLALDVASRLESDLFSVIHR